MESKAILKYAGITPRKAHRVICLIKGKKAGEALVALRFMPYRAASAVEKLLKSAMSNAEQKKVANPENMNIKAFVNQGSAMKRVSPRAMGRANMIKKRTCHITMILSEGEGR